MLNPRVYSQERNEICAPAHIRDFDRAHPQVSRPDRALIISCDMLFELSKGHCHYKSTPLGPKEALRRGQSFCLVLSRQDLPLLKK